MYILQVNPLHLSTSSQPESLVAVARSEDISALTAFVQNCLSLEEDGVTIKYYSGTTPCPTDGQEMEIMLPCTKMFKSGSLLEEYTFPVDNDVLIIDLGSLEERIASLKVELEEKVTADWSKILRGVVEISTIAEVQSITSLEV